jgi:hypothetical protein
MALLLLGVGQLLDPVRLRTIDVGVGAPGLSIGRRRLDHRRRIVRRPFAAKIHALTVKSPTDETD